MEDHPHDDEDDEDPTDMVHDMDFMDSEPTPKEQQAVSFGQSSLFEWNPEFVCSMESCHDMK